MVYHIDTFAVFGAFALSSVLGAPPQNSTWRLEERNVSQICDDVEQHAGYMKLSTGDKNYFYWSFASRSNPANDPVVLWMTGGPGCSSEVALFGENGPCKTKDGATTVKNPFSWNNNATLIYIDQPTGTGFSYGKGLDHDEAGVSADMYDFLLQFFKAHPELSNNDLYVYGESYAGHYVPAVTHAVWKGNKAGGKPFINLKGLSVGNGLTDPEIQYAYYPEMAASTNHHKAALGKVATTLMKVAVPACTAAIKACNAGDKSNSIACLGALEVCNAGQIIPYQLTGLNPYDMRIKCAKPPLCYDFSQVATYLKRPEVQEALGVQKRSWSDCNMLVNKMFMGDWMKNYQNQLPDLLADGIKIYAGDQDFICNWLGNKAWALAMEWPGKQAFNAAADEDWVVDGVQAGRIRQAGNFSFVQVFEAGHMVPLDQPVYALAMVNAFIH